MRLCRLFPLSRMTGLVTNRWMGSRTWKKRERERAEERKRPSESFSVAWMTAAMIHFLTCSCCFSHTLTNAPFPLSVQISHNGTSTLSFLFVLPALDTTSVQPAICAVCRKPCFLSWCSNTIFKLQLEISNIAPSNLADEINKCKWVKAAFITAAKGIWILAL